jgi:hypothetical protein
MQQFHAERSMITPGAQEAINALCASDADLMSQTVFSVLDRHINGDWGEMSQADADVNEAAILSGDRIMSVYLFSRNGLTVRIFVITEAAGEDGLRATTTILLPEEY